MRGFVVLGLGCAVVLGSVMASAEQMGVGPVFDPLAVGKAALQHRDYAGARKFFADVLAANPSDAEAKFYLAESDLQLGRYSVAIAECKAIVAADPERWGAHQCLVFAYAQTEDWAGFDAERARLEQAREHHALGISTTHPDVIDRLTVGGDSYTVFAFHQLDGRFHTRYYFIHFAPGGSRDKWFACESDDVDQAGFAKMHPDLAAQGKRSFSLDSYGVTVGSNGQKTFTQGLMKFYWDGEPSYETVRADVLSSLEKRTAPAATMTK